jgi:hypothetical protein
MPLRDRKNLSGLVYRSLIVLRDDKGACENKATDRKGVSMLALCRPRLQILRFNFRVTVGFKLSANSISFMQAPLAHRLGFKAVFRSLWAITSRIPERARYRAELSGAKPLK